MAANEQIVKHHVDSIGHHICTHGDLCIANAALCSVYQHRQHVEYHAAHDDAKIRDRILMRIGAEPARCRIGSANATHSTLMMAVSPKVSTNACPRIRFALSWSFSPYRRATKADTATLSDKNTARPMNFGCVVSPTEAMRSCRVY